MKAQLLTVVLLFSMVISSAFAQSRNQIKTPAIPEHPLVKTLKLLETGFDHSHALKSTNQNFQLNEIENQVWVNDQWVPTRRTENIYESGNRVESNVYETTMLGDNWQLSSNEVYTYENNNLMSLIYQSFSGGELSYQYRDLYSYQQGAGQVYLQMIEYQWRDASSDEWINDDRDIVTLENGMLSKVLNETWQDGQWESETQYRYEEFEGDIIETTQMYDTILEDWVNDEQYIYSDITIAELYNRLVEFIDYVEDGRLYIFLGMLPDYTFYEWDEEEQSWIAIDRQMTTESSNLRNGATSASSILMESYNMNTEEWEVLYEYVLGYADNGKPVNFSLYTADETIEGETGNLLFSYTEDYNYDENNFMESILQHGDLYGDTFKLANDELPLISRVLLKWGDVSTSIDRGTDPYTFRLNAAYPNPFNPSTVIPFQLAKASNVTIRVYDMLGRNVLTLVNEFMPAGGHTVRFDGSGLSSGVYMIRMAAPGLQQTRSVTLLK